jgi:hypothetical protein
MALEPVRRDIDEARARITTSNRCTSSHERRALNGSTEFSGIRLFPRLLSKIPP